MTSPTPETHRLTQGLIIDPYVRESVRNIARHFAFGDLPSTLHPIAQKFAELAQYMVDNHGDSPDLVDVLRELWKAKRMAVGVL